MENFTELFMACGARPTDISPFHIPDQLEPIEIILRVVPTDIDLDGVVTLELLIDDKLEGIGPGVLKHTEYTTNVDLPLHGINLAKRRPGMTWKNYRD